MLDGILYSERGETLEQVVQRSAPSLKVLGWMGFAQPVVVGGNQPMQGVGTG